MRPCRMPIRAKAILALSCALALVGAGAVSAQAASKYVSMSIYLQEQSNWCWVATSKTMVEYWTGTAYAQCTMYKWAKGGSSCGNQTGGFGDVTVILSSAGIPYQGAVASGARPYANMQSELNINRPEMIRWGWNSTGGSTGHMLIIRGYNTSGSTVSFIDPTLSAYQSNTYAWMKSGGGHTLTHTLWGVYKP